MARPRVVIWLVTYTSREKVSDLVYGRADYRKPAQRTRYSVFE